MTRSSDSLFLAGRSATSKTLHDSDEIVTDDVRRAIFRVRPIDKLRPRSYQETPKTTFFYLSNRYASSMRPAWSFPSLNAGINDQIKLSPDDERPFLDPIPRRNKRNSLPELESPLKDMDFASCLSHEDETTTEMRTKETDTLTDVLNDTSGKAPPKPIRRSFSGEINVDVSVKQPVYISVPDEIVDVVPKKPLPPSPLFTEEKQEVITFDLSKPTLAVKPVIAAKPSNVSSITINNKMAASRLPKVCQKPVLPTRSSSKNIVLKKLREEKRTNDKLNEAMVAPRVSLPSARVRPICKTHRSFTSYENTIFEEGEYQGKLQNTKTSLNRSEEDLSRTSRKHRFYAEVKSPSHSRSVNHTHERLFEHDPELLAYSHRRYHSEPHDGSYNNNTSNAVIEHLKNENATPIDKKLEPISPRHNARKMLSDSTQTRTPIRVPQESASIALEPTPITRNGSPVARNLKPAARKAISEPTQTTLSTQNGSAFPTSRSRDAVAVNRVINGEHSCDSEVSREDQSRNIPDNISITSRTSSMQSLSSINSARSTTSSKHEQMNLRRAVMNVYGQNEHDLTFKAGAILYELRPRNKVGLCFGLLDDSRQGWYPAEAVEVFYDV